MSRTYVSELEGGKETTHRRRLVAVLDVLGLELVVQPRTRRLGSRRAPTTPDPMRLRVYMRGIQVADVIDAGPGDTAVAYIDAAVAAGAPARVSLAMPVHDQPYPAATHGSRWVRSLLPEGRALAHAVREYQVPEDDRFALLSALRATWRVPW